MYSRERDMKKEVAFMKVIQISDFHLRGDGKLSFQKADTMKALHQTIDKTSKTSLHCSWEP